MLIGWLDEGAAYVVVADDTEFERDAAFHRVAHRRRAPPESGNGTNHVG